MQVVHERCAGLDVHKKTVVACVITPAGREVRTFATMTEDLFELLAWLEDHGCQAVAMESTGVYWKPVYNLLEASDFEPLVANAQHIKAVPGRKTDVRDAEWIAELHRHGLLKGSFIPDREQRELRELTRYRRSLVQERTREAARLQKVLEGANIKLASVASDVLGRSGRDMLRAMVEGNEDPVELAQLARGALRKKREALEKSLRGLLGAHQRFLLDEQLGHVEELERRIARLDEEVTRRLDPFAEQMRRLQTVPGIGQRVAEEILAEVGADMSRFATHRHLASWAKVCPGTNESAGKRKSARCGYANRWLRSALVEAAWGAARSKDTFLSAQYRRLAHRIGGKRAAVAVAHSILTISYYVLRDEVDYHELGSDHFEQNAKDRIRRSAVKRLQRLGYEVSLKDAA